MLIICWIYSKNIFRIYWVYAKNILSICYKHVEHMLIAYKEHAGGGEQGDKEENCGF